MSVALQNAGADAVFLTERLDRGPRSPTACAATASTADRALLMGLQPLGPGRRDARRAEPAGRASSPRPIPALLAAFQGRYPTPTARPRTSSPVLAYDGVAAVGALIAEARGQGGSPFSTARLTQPQGFAGASGAFRFCADGLSQRNLAIIEVQRRPGRRDRRARARSSTAVGF